MVFDLQRFVDDTDDTLTDEDDTVESGGDDTVEPSGEDTLTGGGDDTVESGGGSSASGGSSVIDNTVFELIVQAEEPATVPAIGDEGCFNNILDKLEDTQNSQTLRYEVGKQEKAAEATKTYAFGRF